MVEPHPCPESCDSIPDPGSRRLSPWGPARLRLFSLRRRGTGELTSLRKEGSPAG